MSSDHQSNNNNQFEYFSGKFDYYDKSLQQNVEVEVEIYSPGKDVQNNGHLVMISNGMAVSAKEYSALSEKLSSKGYFVVAADFKTFIQFFNRTATVPNMDVLHSLLKKLLNTHENEDPNFPNLNFKDVIILGHSQGGAFSIQDINNNEIKENYKNYFPDIKEEFWDEYVKGVVAFEGWREENLSIPPKNKFLVMTGSKYYREHFQIQQKNMTEEEKSMIDYYVFNDANHYLINNFHGPEQVVPDCRIATNQENFTTTFEEWQRGQDAYVNLLDYEIQKRLLLVNNTFIEKI